ncbi:hypothetical protein STRIP9103_02889 [Streptomyces ipomoeae 91-03]|uniref:Uncharacterized protein n=1 Tax=Streptomyces ipomoeae 91-03 TaxID=698759 RepID=L1KY45_9ACTN|nr:hypothetical protein STRIP9103_02889 [Streptomyces ipomoeae 91-03]
MVNPLAQGHVASMRSRRRRACFEAMDMEIAPSKCREPDPLLGHVLDDRLHAEQLAVRRRKGPPGPFRR